jgi:hypothetical protein
MTERRIRLVLYSILKDMGAKSDLLSIIGSWGDTMEDEEVLKALKEWRKNRGAALSARSGGDQPA